MYLINSIGDAYEVKFGKKYNHPTTFDSSTTLMKLLG
jgi:hypothetical protein